MLRSRCVTEVQQDGSAMTEELKAAKPPVHLLFCTTTIFPISPPDSASSYILLPAHLTVYYLPVSPPVSIQELLIFSVLVRLAISLYKAWKPVLLNYFLKPLSINCAPKISLFLYCFRIVYSSLYCSFYFFLQKVTF